MECEAPEPDARRLGLPIRERALSRHRRHGDGVDGAYIASGPHLGRPWLRLIVAAPACMIPLGYTQVNNDLATAQFIALYGTFWLLLWIPGTRAGRILSPVIILSVTLDLK